MKGMFEKVYSEIISISEAAYRDAQDIVDKDPANPPSLEARLVFHKGGCYYNSAARLRKCLDSVNWLPQLSHLQ